MKKSLLLLAAGLTFGVAQAQMLHKSSAGAAGTTKAVAAPSGSAIVENAGSSVAPSYTWSTAAKTTATGGGRWYFFTNDLFDAYQTSLSKFVGSWGYILWPDTSAIIGYTTSAGTPEYDIAQMTSAGLGFDPTYTSTATPGYGWNECGSLAIRDYTGEVAITAYDAYTIDSVWIGGWYSRNPAKTTVVDTLIVTFIKSPRTGSGIDMAMASLSSPASCYGVVSLGYRELWRDLANARAGHNGGTPTTAFYKFPLTNTDTNAFTGKNATYPRASHPSDPTISFAVGANEVAAATVSFKTGDAAYPAFPGKDTIRISNGTSITGYKFGAYSLQLNYATNSSASGSAAECPYYDPTGNQITGYLGFEGGNFPWHNTKYYPNWTIIGVTSSGTVPSVAQFPNINFHTQCSTCDIVCAPILKVNEVSNLSNVAVTPNPANDQVNITFGLKNATAKVTVTNLLGQQVAAQTVSTGSATFNTAALASGVYVYSINVDGATATGRFVVSH